MACKHPDVMSPGKSRCIPRRSNVVFSAGIVCVFPKPKTGHTQEGITKELQGRLHGSVLSFLWTPLKGARMGIEGKSWLSICSETGRLGSQKSRGPFVDAK